MLLLLSADFFQNHSFFEKKIQEHVLSALIWVQSVCNIYQHMTKVAANINKERV